MIKKGDIVLIEGKRGRVVARHQKAKYGFMTDSPSGRLIGIEEGKTYYEVAVPAKQKRPSWIYSVRAKDIRKVV